jgi:hypothetical protein
MPKSHAQITIDRGAKQVKAGFQQQIRNFFAPVVVIVSPPMKTSPTDVITMPTEKEVAQTLRETNEKRIEEILSKAGFMDTSTVKAVTALLRDYHLEPLQKNHSRVCGKQKITDAHTHDDHICGRDLPVLYCKMFCRRGSCS